jgi:meso-butanediol dehydrogenase/(S,S)-butanediol dehydrogenase/diacetyl reductase
MPYRGSEVDGDVVVVTGGGTGIGAAIAERFESEGAHVVVIGRRAGPLDELAMKIGAMALVADAGNPHDVRTVLSCILGRFGRIDTLICNAAEPVFTPVVETDEEGWNEALHVNLSATFVTAREFLPALVDSAGRIVVVSSLSDAFDGPSMAGFTTAKHALMALTKSLAREYGSRGVRVNAICPGWVETATPADVAAAARFLGSDESSYITGATLVVDGGAHIVDLATPAFEKARSVAAT